MSEENTARELYEALLKALRHIQLHEIWIFQAQLTPHLLADKLGRSSAKSATHYKFKGELVPVRQPQTYNKNQST